VLLCLSAGLAFAMRKQKDKPDSVFRKAWFQGNSFRVFPVISLAYVFFAAVILFFGMLIVDRTSGYNQLWYECFTGSSMNFEKFDTGLSYPFMTIKGRERIREGPAKILVVGDSFVWGDGLTNLNQIWWNVMARELERRGYDCEVYALGRPSASTYDEYLWLRDTGVLDDIRPDLIIIGYVTNDADMAALIPGRTYYDLFLAGEGMTAGEPNAFFPNLPTLLDKKLGNASYSDWEKELVESERLENYNTLVLRPLGELIAHTGIPAIVLPTPETPARKRFELLYRDVLPLFEQAGFPVYNPLDEFLERYPRPNYRQSKYFHASAVNPHPGPATSWFLGEYAADVLEQYYTPVLTKNGNHGGRAYMIEINDWMPYMLEPRALMESAHAARYVIEYPDQSSQPDFANLLHGNFLALPVNKKHVKLNFKYPVRLSSVKIEGADLLSAQVWTLGINEKLGFDDQKPKKWPHGSGRRVTSLLISAKTVDGKQAALTVTIEGEVDM